MKLSEAKLRSLKPQKIAYKLSDGGGLFIYVSTSGSRIWRMKYRFAKREKLLTCGHYPEISLGVARDRLAAARTLLANGQGPGVVMPLKWQASRQDASGEARDSFKALALEWFEKSKGKWSESHAETVMDYGLKLTGKTVSGVFLVSGRILIRTN